MAASKRAISLSTWRGVMNRCETSSVACETRCARPMAMPLEMAMPCRVKLMVTSFAFAELVVYQPDNGVQRRLLILADRLDGDH